MRQFQIPGSTPAKSSGYDPREKRKLMMLAVGAGLVAMAIGYSMYRQKEYEDEELGALPASIAAMEEVIRLPEFDRAHIDTLVDDSDPESRVILEGEALDELLAVARTMTPRHFEEMNTTELDAASVAALLADPSAHRGETYTVRGLVDSLRSRTRGINGQVEYVGRLLMDDDTPVYFVALEAPDSGGYVRVDGVFLKAFNDEDEVEAGKWIEGPLLVAPRVVRSYRPLGEVDGPNLTLYRTVEDADLVPADGSEPVVVKETPFEPFWHMMAYARDLDPDAIDWDAAPELDNTLLKALLTNPDEWRGQPFRVPISRVQDGRVIKAGENPARIESYTQGWLGNWSWDNVVRFRYPYPNHEVQLKDMAFGKGFFLHNFAYESKGQGLRIAPMIVMSELVRFENKEDPIFARLGMVFGGIVVGLILLFVVLLGRDKRKAERLQRDLVRRRRARRERGGGPATPSHANGGS